jgi:hypothetical protein
VTQWVPPDKQLFLLLAQRVGSDFLAMPATPDRQEHSIDTKIELCQFSGKHIMLSLIPRKNE